MTVQEQVVGVMERGGSIDEAEAVIDRSEGSEDMRAALWLLAWSLQSPGRARYEARQMMIMAAAREAGLIYGTD